MFTHISRENKYQLYSIKEIKESNNKIVSSDFKIDFKSKSYIDKVFIEFPILTNGELKFLILSLKGKKEYQDMLKGFYMLLDLEFKRVDKEETKQAKQLLKIILR